MKIQWLRNVTEKLIGIAITRKGLVLEDANHRVREFAERPKAICHICCSAAAVVFCFGHYQYVCGQCLPAHNELTRCHYVGVHGYGKYAQQSIKTLQLHPVEG